MVPDSAGLRYKWTSRRRRKKNRLFREVGVWIGMMGCGKMAGMDVT